MNSQDALHKEEQLRLALTFEEIEQQRASIGPVYRGQDFTEQLLEEKREEARQRLALLGNEPYFGRLDFQEEGRSIPQQLYIGKRGLDYRETGEPYVIDWRAPIASLFYSFTGGEAPAAYEAPDGTIQGDIHRKRNLSIRDKKLGRVVDSYVRGGDNLELNDEFLLYKLGDKKDNKLRDIVSTIQAEQDLIIRAPRYKALLIQGAAGSGKTTVALHRLAFLLYHYQEQIRAERMIIFAPNTMFLDYISGVLPELGVGHVRQTTFSEWALELLEGKVHLAAQSTESLRWFSIKGIREEITNEAPGRFKGSLTFKSWLEARLREYEESFLPKLPFEAWEGHTLSAAMIREWFEVEYRHYPLAARRERLIARMNRWLEMQLSSLSDPKIRKERSKAGKQRLRSYTSKLPKTDALSVYQGMMNRTDGFVINFLPIKLLEDMRIYLKKKVVMPEDLAPLVWIHYSLNGDQGVRFDHIVLDEAQDVPPFQIALLKAYMTEPSFTILGDLAQGIHAYRGVLRWEELSEVFSEEYHSYHELRQSYRSTLEIIEFANRILPHTDTGLPAAEPVFRSGEPVEIIRVEKSKDRIAWITHFIEDNQQRGMQTIALIGRTEEECRKLHEQLQQIPIACNLVTEGQSQYRGGITIVPVYLAKGLEFDAVLIVDASEKKYGYSPQDAKLLYVACTRALHGLKLLVSDVASPLLNIP